MKWYEAMDTFNGELPDGGSAAVIRGQTLPETHPLVAKHKDTALFRLVDSGEEPPKAKGTAKAPAGKGS